MLGHPDRNIRLVAIVLNKIMVKFGDTARHPEVVINVFAFIHPHRITVEQFQQVFGIIPAMFDPDTAKDLFAFDVVACRAAIESRLAEEPELTKTL